MLELKTKIRKITGKKVKGLREKGLIPAVLYGPKIKENLFLEIDSKEFEKAFRETGESTLVTLKIDGKKEDILVLIHDIVKNTLTEKPAHIDFYQPDLTQEIEVNVPLIFEGESLAVKDLGGTLVKNISEVKVKAKPQNLPKGIRVNVEKLRTFEDGVLIGDLNLPEGVKISRDLKDVVAFVAQPEKIEEELAKPVEEKGEEVEKVETKKKEGTVGQEESEAAKAPKETKGEKSKK